MAPVQGEWTRWRVGVTVSAAPVQGEWTRWRVGVTVLVAQGTTLCLDSIYFV